MAKVDLSKKYYLIMIAFLTNGYLIAKVLDYETVMVAEFFRHGARTGIGHTYLKEELKIGKGNLTFAGIRQHYILGAQTRENYPNLFKKTKITNKDYLLYSSTSPRAIISGYSHLQGLYPEENDQNIQKNYPESFLRPKYNSKKFNVSVSFKSILPHNTMVFPIETNEDLVFKKIDKKKFTAEIKKRKKLTTTKCLNQYCDKFKSTAEKLKKTKYDPKKLVGINEWNCLSIKKFYSIANNYQYLKGHHMPFITSELYIEMQKVYSLISNCQRLQHNQMSKLYITKIIKKIKDSFKKKIKQKNFELKYLMFSGHDDQMFPLLKNHKITNLDCIYKSYKTRKNKIKLENGNTCIIFPGFASSFLWELNRNKNSNEWFVRILYNGKPIKFCKNNKDEFYCPFKSWESLVNDEMILSEKEINELYQMDKKDVFFDIISYKILSFILLIIAIILFVVFIWMIKRLKNIKNKKSGVVHIIGGNHRIQDRKKNN